MNVVEALEAILLYIKTYTKQIKPMKTIPTPQPAPVVQMRDRIYNFAKKCLGKDIARTQNELGCAEAVSYILDAVAVTNFPRAGYLSTADLFSWLKKNALIVDRPMPGDIIISPTGTSPNHAAHGHVGIVAYHGILSNNSMTGLWNEYYTIASWNAYYAERLGFPVIYFKIN